MTCGDRDDLPRIRRREHESAGGALVGWLDLTCLFYLLIIFFAPLLLYSVVSYCVVRWWWWCVGLVWGSRLVGVFIAVSEWGSEWVSDIGRALPTYWSKYNRYICTRYIYIDGSILFRWRISLMVYTYITVDTCIGYYRKGVYLLIFTLGDRGVAS